MSDLAPAADGRGRVLIDLSTIWATRKLQPTGIPRVEFEAAAQLIAGGAVGAIWDPDRQGFIAVDAAAFDALFVAAKSIRDLNDIFLASPGAPARWRGVKLAALGALALCRRLAEPLPGFRRRISGLSAGLFGELAPAMTSRTRRRWAWTLRLDRDGAGAAAAAAYREVWRAARYDTIGQTVSPDADDVLLLIGASWEFLDLEQIKRLKAQRGFKIVALTYDLVPIRHPEWQPLSDDFAPRFARSLDILIDIADRLTAISEFVARDLERYAAERGFRPIKVRPVPLCSEIGDDGGAAPSQRIQAAGLAAQPFSLFVSTLSPRKNHMFAYQLWRRLWSERGEKLAPLVFAGSRGWLSGDLVSVMSRDAELWGRKIIFIETPNDAELAWLYQNCGFTLYPSLYEGWGLPITESLAHGKYCLAADNTSLREASQGLAFHADALDGAQWLAELRRIFDEPDYLPAREAEIAARFVKRTWADVGADLGAETAAARGAGR